MDLTKEAMKYLADTNKAEMIEDKDGVEYILKGYERVHLDKARAIETHTLDSVIEYLNSDIDGVGPLIVHVLHPTRVCVISSLLDDKGRHVLMEANAFTNRLDLDWQSVERFNLMLQANFVANEDKNTLLAYIGNLRDENVKNFSDDGVSQTVTVKTGVATVSEAILPNPVMLAPYRTFAEIEQPESTFIFRMREGGMATLVESDGNLWKLEAIKKIKDYISEGLTPSRKMNIRIFG